MSTTRLDRFIRATPARVFHALTDARSVQQWMVPEGMTSEVHEFDAREGGRFRISLTYTGDGAGKSGAKTDTHHGTFVSLVPNRSVVQATEFETDDPALQGTMTLRFTLGEEAGGTRVEAVHEDVPPGVPEAYNAEGWRMALEQLARLVEDDAPR